MTSKPEPSQHDLETQLAYFKQINKLIHNTVLSFAHEFQVPLTYISAYTQLLLEDPQAGSLTETQKEYLELIQKKVKDVVKPYKKLVDILVSLSGSTQPRETDLVKLIKLIEHHNEADVNYTISENIPNVWVDKYWLIRVLNILFASPAFVPIPEQTIALELATEQQYVIIHIKRKSKQTIYFGHGDVGFESCQIGAERQGGFLNWNQPSENTLEFKLGLPIFNEKQSSKEKDVE